MRPSTALAAADHMADPNRVHDGPPNPHQNRAQAAAFRVFITLTDDRLRELPLTERARRAHLTPARYARIASDPKLAGLLAAWAQAQAAIALPDLIREILLNARMAGRDGVNDRKMVLQLAGLLGQKSVNRSEAITVNEIGPRLAQALAAQEAGRAAVPAAGPVLDLAPSERKVPEPPIGPERTNSEPTDYLDSF